MEDIVNKIFKYLSKGSVVSILISVISVLALFLSYLYINTFFSTLGLRVDVFDLSFETVLLKFLFFVGMLIFILITPLCLLFFFRLWFSHLSGYVMRVVYAITIVGIPLLVFSIISSINFIVIAIGSLLFLLMILILLFRDNHSWGLLIFIFLMIYFCCLSSLISEMAVNKAENIKDTYSKTEVKIKNKDHYKLEEKELILVFQLKNNYFFIDSEDQNSPPNVFIIPSEEISIMKMLGR
jgi:hypothetical protein